MKLKQLLEGIEVLEISADPAMEIGAVTYDSRRATPDCLFVAVAGFATDGNLYIPMAMEKGAKVVVTAKKPEGDIPYVLVRSDRLALARIGANFYRHPGSSMTMVGITGTNGKTTATLLLKHVLEQTVGAKVGLIGTTGNWIGSVPLDTERTTPESLDLQALLAKMRDAGCTHVIMEVSSHAIALDRVGGLRFDLAAFTNLTEDHLDFHKTMENYCDTKAILFSRSKKSVVNADDPWAERLCSHATAEVLYTSAKGEAALYASGQELRADSVSFTAVCGEKRVRVSVGIPGRFTVYNVLTVLGCAMQLGIPLESAARALHTAEGVKGRVEVVRTPGKPYTILIDYAHTPDGLENVLASVRDFCKGRLIAVFGCGGDRDPVKRPIMGEIGTRIADLAIITSDNPRTEEPSAIIGDILQGIRKNNYKVIENRVEAIHYAMDIGEKDDIIVLAGKGHETYQEINHVKYPMDEREIVASYLKKSRK